MTVHPARKYPFPELYTKLEEAVIQNRVRRNINDHGLALYTYTEKTVYDKDWDDITIMARGLILDTIAEKIIATPFPKFFNYGERLDSTEHYAALRDMPFETFEKMDGSLIIIYHHNGNWKCATKGSLGSEQAIWATDWLHKNLKITSLLPGITYLAEAIYPQNRIVVDYKGEEKLVLLGAYLENGKELNVKDIDEHASLANFPIVSSHNYSKISELLAIANSLDCNSEGFVIRFQDGSRLKIKGAEYCRIHKIVTGITPLAMWRLMRDSEISLDEIRKQIPEEFWGDFDNIRNLLKKQLSDIIAEVEVAKEEFKELSDKEIGLKISTLSPLVRKFIFAARKNNLLEDKSRNALYEKIRPTYNHLEGYSASTSITRVLENE